MKEYVLTVVLRFAQHSDARAVQEQLSLSAFRGLLTQVSNITEV